MMDAADRHALFEPLTRQIAEITLHRRIRVAWWLALLASAALTALFVVGIVWLFAEGVGIWGVNIPVTWGLDIVNAVWWVGIAHAGTLISALVLLMRQTWRNALNRFAEAMTLFAVTIALIFPVIHLGRPEVFYWMLPIPNAAGVWPQFRSPLLWDVFAYLSYFLLSAMFWYLGLMPDFATLRDRARARWQAWLYGRLALGWRGSAVGWARWRQTYLAVAACAFIVVSVHSAVAMLFASSLLPGWHSTIFPPMFVVGAIFSGLATVVILAAVLRWSFCLDNVITDDHFDVLSRLMLGAGLFTGYTYGLALFHAWFGGDPHARHTVVLRLAGSLAWQTWLSVALSLGVLQALWWARVRRSPAGAALVGAAVVVGMWLERYAIITGGLARDFLPSAWRDYAPTLPEWLLQIGAFGLFCLLFVLFTRFVPLISIFEVKAEAAANGGERHG